MEIVQLNSNAKLSEHLASPSEAALGHSNKLDGSHLSPNFTLGEFTKSGVVKGDSSTSLGMTNGGEEPIRINSGYRSPQLNRPIGGAANSNHLTGCAVDIRVENMEQLLRYAVILMDYADETKQEFDELLIEKNRHGAIWLHFAVRPKDNRRKVAFINA